MATTAPSEEMSALWMLIVAMLMDQQSACATQGTMEMDSSAHVSSVKPVFSYARRNKIFYEYTKLIVNKTFVRVKHLKHNT